VGDGARRDGTSARVARGWDFERFRIDGGELSGSGVSTSGRTMSSWPDEEAHDSLVFLRHLAGDSDEKVCKRGLVLGVDGAESEDMVVLRVVNGWVDVACFGSF
jgi:hypothetical protein